MILQLRLFFTAVQFLTRVPVPQWVGYEPDWLNASTRYLPVVGTLVGLIGAGTLWLGGLAFPPAVGAGLSVAATVLLTGAFHEDGLADTCDGLGGHVNRARALEIMKDSRIGTYGAVSLVLVLGLKMATLTAMLPNLAMAAYVLAHTASRAVPVLLIRLLSYAGTLEHAKAKPMAWQVSRVEVLIAVAWVSVVCAILLWMNVGWLRPIGASLAVSCVATHLSASWLRERLGGYTGDTLGATQQVTELLILLAWLGVPPS